MSPLTPQLQTFKRTLIAPLWAISGSPFCSADSRSAMVSLERPVQSVGIVRAIRTNVSHSQGHDPTSERTSLLVVQARRRLGGTTGRAHKIHDKTRHDPGEYHHQSNTPAICSRSTPSLITRRS